MRRWREGFRRGGLMFGLWGYGELVWVGSRVGSRKVCFLSCFFLYIFILFVTVCL